MTKPQSISELIRPKPASPQPRKRSILVVGMRTLDDRFTVTATASWLQAHGHADLADRLHRRDYEIYDMATLPQKGDAMDAIDADTALVIALCLNGIDKTPGGHHESLAPDQNYSRSNGLMLRKCMQHGAILAVWGNQPWNGVEQSVQIHRNNLWVYLPNAAGSAKGKAAGA